jgi:ribosomal protein S2
MKYPRLPKPKKIVSKLLRLRLIRFKVLKKKHYFKYLTLNDIESRIKKALYIIYVYHIYRKKIIFVGSPLKISKNLADLFKKTKHIFIPTSAWIAGVISNQYSSFKSRFKNEQGIIESAKELLRFKEESDLVVLIDPVFSKALIESYQARLPLISLNTDPNIFDEKPSYKIPGDLVASKKSEINNSVFYDLLISILKKARKNALNFDFSKMDISLYKGVASLKAEGRYKVPKPLKKSRFISRME